MDVLADNIRRAAHGLHVCGLCRHRIDRGERYRDARIADDGTVWTWREHLRCGDFIRKATEPYGDADVDYVMFAECVRESPELAREMGVADE